MAKKDQRSLYEVTINGIKHTFRLSPEDAERYGDAAVKVTPATVAAKQAEGPANKQADAPANKSGK